MSNTASVSVFGFTFLSTHILELSGNLTFCTYTLKTHLTDIFNMTRFARSGATERKKPLEASSWKELKGHNDKGRQPSESKYKLHNRAEVSNRSEPQRQHNTGDIQKQSNKQKTGKTKSKGNIKIALQKHLEDDTDNQEIATVFRKANRSERRRLKRIQVKEDEQVCYNCRGTGHSMSECPEIRKDMESGTGICFKCGSTEHSSSSCKVKLPPGQYPFAKCFICGEMGHLSKQCPDNPRGLYPSGGCCNICESVEHYQKDCPKRQMEGVPSKMLPTWESSMNSKASNSADAELSLIKTKPAPQPRKGPKMVKF